MAFEEAERVVVGIPIAERPVLQRRGSYPRALYTFVVEQSWKGAPADTLTLWGEVTGSGMCANDYPGAHRYLVYATRRGDQLEADYCGRLRLTQPAADARLRALGVPEYTTEPEVLERVIRAHTGPDPELTGTVEVAGWVVGERRAPPGTQVELVEAGWSETLRSSAGFFRIADVRPGLYHLRITLPGEAPDLRLVRIACPEWDERDAGVCRGRFLLEVPL